VQGKNSVSVLVTAGGTQEDIDHAAGRLGSLIADAFLRDGAKVTYLCGETSELPVSCTCDIIKIRNVAQLVETLDTLL